MQIEAQHLTDPSERNAPKLSAASKGDDQFSLTDLYPDAAELFGHAPASLEDVKSSCFVVLDANVLLWPFEFNSASLAEVDRVYGELSSQNRLVVPGQAAREFYKHRSRKVADISESIEGTITRAKSPALQKKIPLLQNDPDYKAAQELSKQLIATGKKLIDKLEAVKTHLQSDIAADPVSAIYRKQLSKCVVELDPMDRVAISAEVERRGRLRIAPGFKDQAKEDGGVGDYLIWLTILETAAKRKSHCIFVTNEEKSDWWIKSGGAFQPRPELIDEYRRASGGSTIHLLPLSELLSLFFAKPAVVQGVQDLEEASRQRQTSDAIELAKTVLGGGRDRAKVTQRELENERYELEYKLAQSQRRIEFIQNQISSDIPASMHDDFVIELQKLVVNQRAIRAEIAENILLQKEMNSLPDYRSVFSASKGDTELAKILGMDIYRKK